MSDVDEQLMQHSKDFFDTIFSEIFHENSGQPIDQEMFNRAVEAMGIDGSDLE